MFLHVAMSPGQAAGALHLSGRDCSRLKPIFTWPSQGQNSVCRIPPSANPSIPGGKIRHTHLVHSKVAWQENCD